MKYSIHGTSLASLCVAAFVAAGCGSTDAAPEPIENVDVAKAVEALGSPYPIRLIHTENVNVSDATIKTNLTNAIAVANQPFQAFGIQFAFDSVNDFVSDRRALIDDDCTLPPGTNLNNYTDPNSPPPCDPIPNVQERLRLADLTPQRLVLFVGNGDTPIFDAGQGHWAMLPRGGHFSGPDLNHLAFSTDVVGVKLRHELGHYFHLDHTFAEQKSLADAANAIKAYVAAGHPEADGLNAFDADNPPIGDTPPDPGKVIYANECDVNEHPVIDVVFPDVPGPGTHHHSYTVNPDRADIMSYFTQECLGLTPHFSNEQGARMNRAFLFNRSPLVNGGPAFSMSPPSLAATSTEVHVGIVGGDGGAWLHHVALNSDESAMPMTGDRLYGDIVGSPTVLRENGKTHLFARGVGNGVWHRVWSTSGWFPPDGWEAIGGDVTAPPAAVSWASNRIDLFARGSEGAVWHKTWDGQWNPPAYGWESLGQNTIGSPAVTSMGAGRLDVVALRTDGVVLHKRWSNNAWTPSGLTNWTPIGGTLAGNLTITNWGVDKFDIVAKGSDGHVYHKAYRTGAWQPSQTTWEPLGGNIVGSPVMVASTANRLDIFARGGDSQIWHKTWDTNTWNPAGLGWEALGGNGTSSPAAVAQSATTFRIYMVDSGGNLESKRWNGTSWKPSLLGWTFMGRR